MYEKVSQSNYVNPVATGDGSLEAKLRDIAARLATTGNSIASSVEQLACKISGPLPETTGCSAAPERYPENAHELADVIIERLGWLLQRVTGSLERAHGRIGVWESQEECCKTETAVGLGRGR